MGWKKEVTKKMQFHCQFNPQILLYVIYFFASGLLAVFLDVCNNLSGYGPLPTSPKNPSQSRMSQTSSHSPTSKPSSFTSFRDVLHRNQVENSTAPRLPSRSRSPSSRANAAAATSTPPMIISTIISQQNQIH